MMPRRILLFLALCGLPVSAAAQPSAAWRTDVPCTAGRNPALAVADSAVETPVPGCVRAHCIALPDGRRVCTCTADTTIVVRVEAGGRTLHEWPADYSFAGAPESLRAMTGDLDGDGRPELVVRELRDMSNGLGIHYHELRIFDGRDPARAPVRVGVHDFDAQGSFVRPASGGDCRLIATRWQALADPRRGEGMYFIGQWMRYRDGRLEHDFARPVVARRLLDSFAEARFDTPGAPFAHLAHRAAEARPDHDTTSFPPLGRRNHAGHVRTVRGDTVTIEIPSESEVARYQLGDFYADDGWHHTTWLVDGATGRPYPARYAPSDPAWLDGAPMRIRTYAAGQGRTVNLVFIQPRTAPQP